MNKALIIFFTLLFSFTSFSVFAKEYIMTCDMMGTDFTYKLVDTASTKKLYYRSEGGWIEFCKENEIHTYKHKGDGAVCITKVPSSYKPKKEDDSYVYATLEQTHIFDFILYTIITEYPNPKDDLKTTTSQCKKLK